jgi:hypothetical protein
MPIAIVSATCTSPTIPKLLEQHGLTLKPSASLSNCDLLFPGKNSLAFAFVECSALTRHGS